MTSDLVLVIGNKRYSSWSLRPWLALTQAGLEFREIVVPLRTEEGAALKERWCPSGTVPVLHHDGVAIWESLAIAEYVAETFPEARLWPERREERAVARALANEMHAGFRALRMALPMNVARPPAPVDLDTDVKRDIARIAAAWTACRRAHRSAGPFLFGRFSIADAMFAPVCFRFQAYAVTLADHPEAAEYAATMLALPAMRAWQEAGRSETWRIPAYEQDRG